MIEMSTRADLNPPAESPEITSSGIDAEANRLLRAQYTEIAQLAGGLAHEIRNPLSTMGLNLDLIAEEFPDPESPRDKRIVQKIERIRRETRRLQEILEDFLRFARVQELRKGPTDLNEVVDELRDFCEPQCAVQSIVIRTQYEILPPVRIDADLFKQALLNLILNAQRAMPDGGELMLRTRLDGKFAVLDVIDTGMGMDEELQAKVFNAFFSTRPGGSGLGLATTRKIVEAHGGTIGLRSDPGRGSQFTLRLPIEPVSLDERTIDVTDAGATNEGA
jgi:two-component system sensor histidine kinase HydH